MLIIFWSALNMFNNMVFGIPKISHQPPAKTGDVLAKIALFKLINLTFIL
jgi:hypothetical protein